MRSGHGIGRVKGWIMPIAAIGLAAVVGCSKAAPPKVAAEPPAVAAEPRQVEAAPADAVAKIDAIAERGSVGAASLPMLIESLEAAAPAERWHAARAIGMIGETAVSAIPKLVEHLGDADPIVATQAAAAIGRIRKDDQRPAAAMADDAKIYDAAVKPLADTLVHKDPRVRRAALRSLRDIHPDADALVEIMASLLVDEDPSVVLPAIQSLADMGPDAVPFLAKALEHPKARYWAELALAEIGPAAVAAAPKLAELAAAGEPEERLQAIMSLAAIGEPAGDAAGPLLEIVANEAGEADDQKDAFLEPAAIYALGKIRAAKAFDEIAPFLESRDPVVAAMAAWARARIRPDDAAAGAKGVELLTKGLESKNPTIRQGAISGLSDLVDILPAGGGKRLAETYASMLGDEDPDVRRSAAVALVKLGADAVAPAVEALDDAGRRAVVFEILSELGPLAAAAVPKLSGKLADPDPTVRADAAFALGAIGPEAASAVPSLASVLDEPLPAAGDGSAEAGAGRRFVPAYAAAYALGKIGAAAKPAAERLEALVGSSDPFIATVAAWAGLKIEPDRKELYGKALPLLSKALKSDNDLARLEAASTLGELGRAAAAAVPLLEMVAEDDPVAPVREAAEEALRRIR